MLNSQLCLATSVYGNCTGSIFSLNKYAVIVGSGRFYKSVWDSVPFNKSVCYDYYYVFFLGDDSAMIWIIAYSVIIGVGIVAIIAIITGVIISE